MENTCKSLITALEENSASYSKCYASYIKIESSHSTQHWRECYCILGPYFLKEIPEAVQVALQYQAYPREAAPSSKRTAQRPYGWPQTSKSEWPKWVNRLKTTYAAHWKRAGIYDAIIMSTSDVPLDRPLVDSGLCFWNSATNTMDLPSLGMMSPTLLDVAAITGFRPHGIEVSACTIPHHTTLNLESAILTSYSQYLGHFKGKEEVTMEEHRAFLLYWLCKYVFCVASGRVNKEWAGLAEALAKHDNIALGPIVLAHLYRGLHKMVHQPLNGNISTSGPIWLFQMWLQLYFPELAPPLVSYHQDQILGDSLAAATPPNHDIKKCFDTLHQCTSRTDDQWSVCLNRTYPSFLQLSWTSNSDAPPPEISRDVWASILTTRDLHYGVKIASARGWPVNNCGVEIYCPNHFSRQLGCMQYIPVPVPSSLNKYSSWRKKIDNEVEVRELSNMSEIIRGEFKLQPSTKSFKFTHIFKSWWENQMKYISSLKSNHLFSEFSLLHGSFKQSVPGEEDKARSTPVYQHRMRASTEHSSSPASSILRFLPSKRSQSDVSNVVTIGDDVNHVITIDDDDEEDKEDDEMPVATFLSKKQRNQEFQYIPPGIEQVKSGLDNEPSRTEIPPLRSPITENSRTPFPSELSDVATARKAVLDFMNTSLSPGFDMEGFDEFKAALQVLKDSGYVSSNEFPMLQELEAHLLRVRSAQREIRRVDEGLALLPIATSKMEASVKRCSELKDKVEELKIRQTELEDELAQVRTHHDTAVGELKLEELMRVPIQQSLNNAAEFKERKTQLVMEMSSISKQYETTMGLLKAQLGLDKVPANICNIVRGQSSGTVKQEGNC